MSKEGRSLGCQVGPRAAELSFPLCVCVLPGDDTVYWMLSFPIFSFRDNSSFRNTKITLWEYTSWHNPFLCVCVCPKRMGGLRLAPPSCSPGGTSPSHRKLPFALIPGGQIRRHPPAADFIKRKTNTWLCNRQTFFLTGFCGGGVQPFVLLCAVHVPPGHSWSCSPAVRRGSWTYVYKPELSTESEQYYECLCIQEKLLLLESPRIAINALLDLPLNYWDILFISHPLSPKATLSEGVLLILVSSLMPSSLPSCGTLPFRHCCT